MQTTSLENANRIEAIDNTIEPCDLTAIQPGDRVRPLAPAELACVGGGTSPIEPF